MCPPWTVDDWGDCNQKAHFAQVQPRVMGLIDHPPYRRGPARRRPGRDPPSWLPGASHCTTECIGLHAATRATRFEALEPIRQGVRERFARSAPASPAGGVSGTTAGRTISRTTFNRRSRSSASTAPRVSWTVGFLKGKSAIRIHREYLGRQRNFTGYHFWERGVLRQHGRFGRRGHPRVHPLTSSRVFVGDEGNDQAELDGYGLINLRTSYQATGRSLQGLSPWGRQPLGAVSESKRHGSRRAARLIGGKPAVDGCLQAVRSPWGRHIVCPPPNSR